MVKKILGINGSPRIGGNTDILLDNVLNGAKSVGADVEKIILNNLDIKPCQECENVRKDGVCIVNDDMHIIYNKINNSDGIILASPIFFGSLSAQTKIMIDRFQCIWTSKYINKVYKFSKYKKGVFLCVEASNSSKFFENAKSIVKNFFATIDTEYSFELLCSGVDKKGDILNHKDCLEKSYEIGTKIVSLV
jgi:multimeric flavodoxin WrbA